MAMNKSQIKAEVVTALSEGMSEAYDNPASQYVEFAELIADNVVDVIIQNIFDNAETTPSGEGII